MGSEIILASAGSGKTYQLTNRFVKLLALGVEPEAIVALTFTRKAAGEFLDAILEKLAEAASDEGKAAALASELGVGDAVRGGAVFLVLLRRVVGAMHRLNLGTLDSFFVRAVQGLPLELGLGGEIEVMGDAGAVAAARRDVYEAVFRGAERDEAGMRAFALALKEASYGHEERRMVSQLDRFVEEHHRVLLAVPEREKWGDAGAIWGGAPAFPPAGHGTFLERVGAFEDRLWAGAVDEKQAVWWREFFEEAKAHVAGASMPTRLGGMVSKLIEIYGELAKGGGEMTVNRKKFGFDAATANGAKGFVDGLVGLELDAKLLRTRGLWAVLAKYEAAHERRLRRRGRLGFDDLAVLLGRLMAERDGVAADLAYRLDGRFDHWMLDEFQDTSRAQWRAVAPLVDEVVQDPEGRRSYFQVGDLKQSIYGWRGGDPTLMVDVLERYAGEVKVRPLDESFRSVPAVLEAVNRVFGDAGGLAAHLPEPAVERLDFREHRASGQTEKGSGFACLVHPEVEGKASEEDVFAAALGVVQEIDPLRRGLTCAVLCQKGATIEAVVNHFRAAGFADVVSGAKVAPAADCEVVAGLVALARAAAYPADGMACGQVAMTPLRSAWEAEGMTWEAVQGEVVEVCGREGFEAFVRLWWKRLEASGGIGEGDAFGRHRLGALAELARRVDEGGARGVRDFLVAAETWVMEEVPESGVVQVMTVHASKGLGFDVVIVPELAGNKNLKQPREGLGVGGTAGAPAWVLDLPRKEIRELDPVLREQLEDAEVESAFESLCRLYVAMTRPKRGLYLVAPKRSGKALNFLALLDDLLGEGEEETAFGGVPCVLRYATGEREWFEEAPVVEQEAAAAATQQGALVLGPRRRLKRRAPSEAAVKVLGNVEGRAFGREVHAAFEQLEWAESYDGGHAVVARCLESEEVRALLSRPAGDAVVWRERGFEAVVDGEWVSGTFDRVVLERDLGGFVKATVVDFKTDKVKSREQAEERAAGYAGQMELYRKVVGQLAGLADEVVEARLVFVGGGWVV